MNVERICIIGTGLIGCSFSLALKQAGFTGHIVGNARRQQTLDEALANGSIDSGCLDLAEAVRDADLVFLSVPMLAMRNVLTSIKDVIKPDTIITDGGSVKGCFIQDVRAVLDQVDHVVPGHPIAGREKSGALAAQVDLYRDKRVLLTPLPETRDDAVATVTRLWEMAGALVERLPADKHDRVLAATSHLPHVLAFGLVDLLAERNESEDIFRYAAGGFKDFTRIASGDPVMWRDICLTNPEEIVSVLDQYLDKLAELRQQIESADGAGLCEVFERSRSAREKQGLSSPISTPLTTPSGSRNTQENNDA